MASSAILHLLFLSFLPFLPVFGASKITLGLSLSAINDNSSWISPSGEFAFGFRQLDNTNILLAIWYANIPQQTIVWHADTTSPVQIESKVELTVNGLTLNSPNGEVIWKAQPSTTVSNAAMLDTGNFVLSRADSVYIWESFKNPTDTILPTQMLSLGGMLYSRLTETNYSKGRFELDFMNGALELRPVARPSQRHYKFYYSSETDSTNSSESGFQLVFSQSGNISIVKGNGATVKLWSDINLNYANNYFRATLGFDGVFRQYTYSKSFVGNQSWSVVRYIPDNICLNLMDDIGGGACGFNSYCVENSGTPSCLCPPGYNFIDPNNTFGGCQPNFHLDCEVDGSTNPKDMYSLTVISNVNWPLGDYDSLQPYNQTQCEQACLDDCSCAVAIFDGNITCWKKRLPLSNGRIEAAITIMKVRKSIGVSYPAQESPHGNGKKIAILVTSVVVMSFLIIFVICWLVMKKKTRRDARFNNQANDEEKLLLPIFDMISIAEATNNFSETNKIGEGGFGPVYKGQLSMGQDMAVKRLSTSSKQGVDEFKNEVILIAKLQHRNLVTLLGCCIHGEERMLAYEYMPNGSLDSFIFGSKNKRKLLTWTMRLDIIVGIARGVVYLHQDSRLKIIHRDLKVSNVLLDGEMNPKISDFGLARTFEGDQSSAQTRRVVGTYGYMSPEYAIDGLFSMKSDVFSFGVIVLEIISGKRNQLFHNLDHDFNLLGHAWKLWIERKAYELLDPLMEGSLPMSKVLRCIHVGLLCVQKCLEDRPTMSSVLLMLVTENTILPQPKQPGFYTERSSIETHDHRQAENTPSINEVTMTQLDAR